MPQLNQWRMPSNKGFSEITFEALAFHHEIDQVEYNVSLLGKKWDRSELDNDEPALINDFNICLSSILVPKVVCEGLRNAFDNWLTCFAPFTHTLCAGPDNILTIQVGKRDDCITTLDHPAFTFTYVGRCNVEVFFQIDQSCVRAATEGIAHVLQSLIE